MPFTPDDDDLRINLAHRARRTLGRAKSFLRRPPFQNSNNNFANRITLHPVSGGSASFNNTGFTVEIGENSGGTGVARTGWYKITPTARRIFRFRMTSIATNGILQNNRLEFYDGASIPTLTRFLTHWATNGGGDSAANPGNPNQRNAVWTNATIGQWHEVQLTPEEIQIQVAVSDSTQQGVIAFDWEEVAPPANDDWADAIELIGDSGTESGTTVGATWDTAASTATTWPSYIEPADFQPWPELMRGVVWYKITSLTQSVYRLTLEPTGTGEDMRLLVVQGDSYPSQVRKGWALPDETLDVQLDEGEYWVAVVAMNLGPVDGSDYSRWRDTFDLHWEKLDHPDNDYFLDAEEISGDTGTSTNTDLTGATIETDEPIFNTVGQEEADLGSVWWHYTPSTSGSYTVETVTGLSDDNNAFLQMYKGDDIESLVSLVFNNTFLSDIPLSVLLGLTAGEDYYFRLNQFSVYDSYAHIETNYGGLSWTLEDAAPTNDDFVNAEVISGSSGSVSGTNVGATWEEDEFPVSYDLDSSFYPTVWYQWEAPSTGYFRFGTVHTSGTPDLDLMIFTGSSVDALTPVVENWDGTDPYTNEALLEFEAAIGTTYYIRVNSFNWANTGVFDLEWQTASPPTNDDFVNAIALPSTESGGPTIYDNLGADIALEDGEPVDDIFASLNDDNYLLGRTVWFTYQAPTSGLYEFIINAAGFEGVFAVYEGIPTADFANLTFIGGDDCSYGPTPIEFAVDSAKTYYIQVFGYGYPTPLDILPPTTAYNWTIQQGQFDIEWSRIPVPPDNDDLSPSLNDGDFFGNIAFYGIPDLATDDPTNFFFRPSGGCYDATSRDATAQAGELSVAGFGPERTVWFYWQSSFTGTMKFWTTSSVLTDQVMAVYQSNDTYNPASPGTLLDSDDDSGPGLMPECQFAVTAFEEYLIQVDTKDNPGGEFTLNWVRVTASPPINDNFADAIELSLDEGPTTLSGTTIDATVECDEPAQYFNGPHGSVWYHINSPVDRDILLTLKATSDANTNGIAAIVYRGSTLADLADHTDGDYPWVFDLNEEGSFSYQLSAGVDYYIAVVTVNDNGVSGLGATFDLTHELSSTTPPDGDPFEAPIDSSPSAPGGPILTGTTEGATTQDGESGLGGGFVIGTVWHKFVPDFDGIYDINVEADDPNLGTNGFLTYSVWEGPSLATIKPIPGYRPFIGGFFTSNPRVLRAGSEYYIRVEREQGDGWGTYTLNIVEYHEHDDWTSAGAGYDSISGSGGYDSLNDQLTFTGPGSALVDPWLDGDGDPENAGLRWIQMRFKMRVIGVTMFREDHFNLLGVVRALDPNGDPVWELVLSGNEDGTNSLAARDPDDGDTRSTFAHFGSRGRDFNEWVDVEVFLRAYTGRESIPTVASSGFAINGVKKRALVNTDEDGVPVTLPIRSLEWGAFHYPNSYNTTLSSVGAPYQDPHDDWEIQIKDVVVRDRPTLGMIPSTDTGDLGITQFDGWEHGDKLDNIDPGLVFGTPTATIVDAPGTPPGNADWWKAVRFKNDNPNTYPGGSIYNSWNHNCRPYMGFWMYFEQWPTTDDGLYQVISIMPDRSDDFTTGWAALMVGNNGELRIAPQVGGNNRKWKSYCVASLRLQTWYWIEMELDASIVHEAKVNISINGNAMGEFQFANSRADLVSLLGADMDSYYNYGRFDTSKWPVIWSVGSMGLASTHNFITETPVSFPNYGIECEFYIAHVCMGRVSMFPLNPMQTKLFGGVDEDAVHNIPELPADPDHEHLHTDARPYIWTFYNFTDETDTPNPSVGPAPSEFSWGTPGGGTIDVIADGTGNALIAAFNAIRWQPRPTIPDSPFGTRHFPRHGHTPYLVYEADEGGTSTDMFASTAWVKGVGDLIFGDESSSGNAPVYSHITRTLSGTYEQSWSIAPNAWHPSVTSAAARLQGEWENMIASDFMYWKRVRFLLNPEVYPRFATSADNGATWTFVDDPTITTTNNFIGADVTVSSGNAVFMNNSAAMTRMFEIRHGIQFPFGDYGLHSVGYEMRDWYLEYTSVPSVSIPEAEEFGGTRGYNLHLRHAGYRYTPSTERVAGDLYVVLNNGTHNCPMHVVTATESDISRVRYPTDTTGGHWTTTEFGDTLVRFGFYRAITSGSSPGAGINPSPGSWTSSQGRGAVLEAVQWEVLSEAAPGPSAQRCRRLQQIYRRAFG